MLITTSETLGSAKASVLRRVTTTTFVHSGFLIRSCTMRPPTFPVAPSTIAEYFASGAAVAIVTSHAPGAEVATDGLFFGSFYLLRFSKGFGVTLCPNHHRNGRRLRTNQACCTRRSEPLQ
jgi:hypothetical protein